MKNLDYIMNYYKKEHMIKFYTIGIVISLLYLYGKYMELEGMALRIILFDPRYFLFYSLSTLFYPFAMGAYIELKIKIFRNVNLFTIIMDLMFGILLFILSAPVGIIKMLLIYFTMNNNNNRVIRSDVEYKSQDESDDIIW